jgi:dienelactone hydrolase
MARAGLITTAVISFHGALDAALPPEPGKLTAKVLALHGAEDPFVPADKVAAFEEEMRQLGADCQLVKYSGVVHSFTNAKVGNDKSKGMAYDEKADHRSHQAMKDLLAEAFA